MSRQVSPLFSQLNPANRDEAVVEAAGNELAKASQYLEHFMGSGPFAVAGSPSLGDCALAPYMVLMRQMVYANFPSIQDPTAQPGRLQDWWQAVSEDPILGPGMTEYDAAFKEFVKMIMARA